jgi:hypothetical protein
LETEDSQEIKLGKAGAEAAVMTMWMNYMAAVNYTFTVHQEAA